MQTYFKILLSEAKDFPNRESYALSFSFLFFFIFHKLSS